MDKLITNCTGCDELIYGVTFCDECANEQYHRMLKRKMTADQRLNWYERYYILSNAYIFDTLQYTQDADKFLLKR